MKARPHAFCHFAFFIACVSFFIPPAQAQEWTLSTADFRTEAVGLRAIDDKGVHVMWQGHARLIPPDQFVQVDRSGTAAVERTPKFMLTLVGAGGGDHVGGEPVKIEDDRLTWRNASVGEIVIPLAQVAAIAKPDQAIDPSARRTDDAVLLANGDRVTGVLTGISADRVQVKSASAGADDPPTSVPLDSVLSIHLASTTAPTTTTAAAAPNRGAADAKKQTYRVRLDDGSSLVVSSLTLAEEKLLVKIGGDGGGGEARPLAVSAVAGIEQVNGPVSWLTSRTPSEDVQVPFIASAAAGALWRTRVDTDVTGAPLLVAGRAFKRGIGVHSYSRLVYPLDGSYKAFRTRYGINDSLTRADVTVRILAGGKVVHEAKNVGPGELSPVVVVELPSSARTLTLEVDYGEGIDVEDRLSWLEPALLREMPKPEPPPPAAPTTQTRPATQPASTQPASRPVSTQPAAAAAAAPAAGK
jgi:hypothetical protein